MFATLLCFPLMAAPAQPQAVVGGAWERSLRLDGAPVEMLGEEVIGCGDLDGDGYADFAASATWAVSQGTKTGAVVAYSGRDGAELWRFLPTQPDVELGASLARLDDLDGDGVAELASGAPFAAVGSWFWTGSVFVISGRTGALLRRHDGSGDDQAYGYAVGACGDLDGDGVGELLVGAPRRNPNGVPRGGAGYVYSGASGALLHEVDGGFAYGFHGWAAVGLDDRDGDGVPEFCFSSPQATVAGQQKAGHVAIYSGATGAIYRGHRGEALGDLFGSALATCADVDGDGSRELLVGAPEHGFHDVGAAYLYSGGEGALLWKWTGENDHDQLGYALAGGGDLDGDGDPDAALGAWLTDYGGSNAGSAYLVDGASGALIHRVDAQAQATGPLWFGQALAIAPDLQRDGLDDLVAGIPDAGGFQLHGAVEVHSLAPFLIPDRPDLSAAAGPPTVLRIDFPASEAGVAYQLLASGSGTGPSAIAGVLVPLATDALTLRLAGGWVPPNLAGGRGQLDAAGDALAVLAGHPRLVAAVGRSVHLAVLSYDRGPQPGRLSSIARTLVVVP